MRISDWSSDMCSSNLVAANEQDALRDPLSRRSPLADHAGGAQHVTQAIGGLKSRWRSASRTGNAKALTSTGGWDAKAMAGCDGIATEWWHSQCVQLPAGPGSGPGLEGACSDAAPRLCPTAPGSTCPKSCVAQTAAASCFMAHTTNNHRTGQQERRE